MAQNTRPHREFGERLAGYRRLRRYTQVGLSGITGIPLSTLRMYEAGRTMPSALRLHYLVEELEITTGDLLDPVPENELEGIMTR